MQWRDWAITPGYLVGGAGVTRREGFSRVEARMLVTSFESDFYAPRRAVDAFATLFERASVERWHIGDRSIGHFNFFRAAPPDADGQPAADRTSPWSRVADFLLAPEEGPAAACA